MVTISIIMPLYNAEKYLEETLHSILKQTYKEFELICINDASTDTTMDILQKFKKKDNRIRIMNNHKHLGAALSRNGGGRRAKGKYITFLDGDDVFDEKMLESAYVTAEKYEADIVMYEYKRFSGKMVYDKRYIERNDRYINKYCKSPFSVYKCEPIEFMEWRSGPRNKFYNKSFIERNQLKFQSLPSSNDVYFMTMALLLAEKIIILNDRTVMAYARDHTEVSRISYDRDPMCAFLAIEKLGRDIVERKLFNELYRYFYYFSLYNLISALMNTKNKENAEKFYLFLQKEGINNIISLNPSCYQKVESYIRILLENFKKLDFESGWYKHENPFSFYLHKNEEKLISLFQSYERKHIKAALWGAGQNGGIFLHFLNKHNMQIAEVTDIDRSKHGKLIEGYEIKSPEEVLASNDIQVIFVCTYDIYTQVVKRTDNRPIEMVVLEDDIFEIFNNNDLDRRDLGV